MFKIFKYESLSIFLMAKMYNSFDVIFFYQLIISGDLLKYLMGKTKT